MKGFTISKNFRNALFVFFIALFAFMAFEPLLASLGLKATQEYAIAIFGTIIAAIITMLLLTKQTETEEEKDRNDKVFEQKITIYNQTIDTLQSIFENTDENNQVKISRKEIIQIEFLLAKIMMVGSTKTIHEFKNFYDIITSNYSTDSEVLTINSRDKQIVFRFVDYCREELGLSDRALSKSVLEDIVLQGELLYNMERVEGLPSETIETIKDVYGYLVFDLNLHYRNIDFSSDGFDAYINDKHTDQNRFVRCVVSDQNVVLTLPCSCAVKDFEHELKDDLSIITFKPEDRQELETHFYKVEKLIKESLVKVKHQK